MVSTQPPITEAGPWRLGAPLGRGGFGQVYRATDTLGRQAALKLVALEGLDDGRFELEIRRLAALAHPNVLQLHDAGRLPSDIGYLATPIAGGSTADVEEPWLRRHLASLIRQLTAGLAHAHGRGIIHGDIKPDNLLLRGVDGDEDGADGGPQLWVGDFGHARLWGDYRQPSAGTVAVMAPEQLTAQTRDIGPWTDVFSVGVVVFRWLTGRWPFVATSLEAALRDRHRPVPASGLGAAVDAQFRLLLQPDWRRRVDHITDARDRLLAVAACCDAMAPISSVDRHEIERATAVVSERFDEPAPTAPEQDDTSACPAGADQALYHPSTIRCIALRAPKGSSSAPLRGTDEPSEKDPAPLRHPLVPWRVEGLGNALPARGRQVSALRRVALVGRERLRDILWDGLEHVCQTGSARTYGILGSEPGVGCSSLASWLAETAYALGLAQVLRVGEGRHAIADAFLARCGAADLATPLARARCEAWCEWLGAGDAASSLALAVVDPEAIGRHQEWAAAMGSIVALLARRRPLIVLASELHDATVPVAAEAPVLWVGVGSAAASGTTLEVGPLDPAAMATLVRRVLGVSEGTAGRIARRARGNPSYARLLMQTWIDAGVLEPARDGYVLARAELPAPLDRGGLWRGVIDAAAPSSAERQALWILAAIDAELHTVSVREAVSTFHAVTKESAVRASAALRRLVAGGHVTPSGRKGLKRWRFAVGLSDALLDEARGADQLHGARVAMAEAAEASDAPEHVKWALVASLRLRTGAPERSEAAADHLALKDPTIASYLLEALSTASPRTPGLLALRAEASWCCGDNVRAEEDTASALAMAPQHPRALWVAVRLALTSGDVAAAATRLKRLEPTLVRGELRVADAADLAIARAKVALFGQHWDAATSYLAPLCEDTEVVSRTRARALLLLNQACQGKGDLAGAQHALDETGRVARLLGASVLAAHCLIESCDLAANAGRWREALGYAERACELTSGRPPLSCYAWGNRAVAALGLGDARLARRFVERAAEPDAAKQKGRLWLFVESIRLVVDAHEAATAAFDTRLAELLAFLDATGLKLADCRRLGDWASKAWRRVGDAKRADAALELIAVAV